MDLVSTKSKNELISCMLIVLSSSHKMVSLGQSGNGTWPEGIKVEEYFIESSRSLVQRCTHRFLEPISTHLSIYLPSSYHLPIICLPIYVSALMAQWVKNLPAIQETQA